MFLDLIKDTFLVFLIKIYLLFLSNWLNHWHCYKYNILHRNIALTKLWTFSCKSTEEINTCVNSVDWHCEVQGSQHLALKVKKKY